MQCKAAISNGDGHFFIDTIEVGDPADDEVLIEMEASGICHTDYDSLRWGTVLIPGHEGAGIVKTTGKDVRHVATGDHVILNWAIPCGKCFQCLEGNESLCENNSPVIAGNTGRNNGHAHAEGTLYKQKPVRRSFNLGTLSELTLVKSAAVVRIPKSIPFASACIVGCGVMTGFGSVMNAAKVKTGSSVVVLGAGGVGLNVIQATRIAGAAIVIAIDTNQNRLEFAKQFGATHVLRADVQDKNLLHAASKVKSMTSGRGADYAFECTAIPELGGAPLAMVRNGGMALQLSGIEQEILLDMNLFEWDKTYMNPLYGKCRPQSDIPKIIELYLRKELLLDELVTSTYSLHELDAAFKDMLAGKNAKGVITF